MSYAPDPEHIYVNLSASAGAETTLFSTDPVAVFREKRNAPIMYDCSKYRVAVARADLQGCRTLPLFIPTIDPTTDDPYRTTYKFTLTMKRYTANGQAWPSGNDTPTRMLFYIRTTDSHTNEPSGIVALDFTIAPNLISNVNELVAQVETGVQAAGVAQGNATVAGMTVRATPDGKVQFVAPDDTNNFYLSQTTSSDMWDPSSALGFPDGYVYGTWLGSTKVVPGTTLFATWTGTNLPYANQPLGPNTQTASAVVQWIPQAFGLSNPPSPLQNGGQSNSVAYWAFDYDWIVALFNTALQSAWASLTAQFAVPLFTVCPVLVFNKSAKTFTLYADAYSTPSLNAAPLSSAFQDYKEELTIGFNEFVSNLLMLPATFVSTGQATCNYSQSPLITVAANTYSGGAPPLPPSGAWVGLTNAWSPTASLWTPVGSIVFTTRVIPVQSESLSAPSVYGAPGDVGAGAPVATSSSSSLILSDVVPVASDSSDFRSNSIIYAPSVLRWVDMPAGGFRLDEIDFELGWRNNRTGEITPIRLNPMASFSAKLLFRRKDIID